MSVLLLDQEAMICVVGGESVFSSHYYCMTTPFSILGTHPQHFLSSSSSFNHYNLRKEEH